jgi:hypothetical protein
VAGSRQAGGRAGGRALRGGSDRPSGRPPALRFGGSCGSRRREYEAYGTSGVSARDAHAAIWPLRRRAAVGE